ncbi:proteasome assembly chaperone family protein [Candidatus Woesearchaeota archaeon]|nr:proteasome assembly chaperone family protein [Candidatus Woesearchaeota archaeon]
MEVKLWKKPKKCTIIEGFPGFGLVGTIASEFLIEHLKPLGIFYNEEHNIVIVHAITAATHLEWEMAQTIGELASDLQANEIVSLEGVGSSEESEGTKVFYYSNSEKSAKRFEKAGITALKEGIIIGVTGAILLRVEKTPLSCLFAETHTNLPDSKAAAKIVEAIDKYLGINLDYKPLLEQAAKFEEKLKTILQKSQEAQEISDKKKLSYLG